MNDKIKKLSVKLSKSITESDPTLTQISNWIKSKYKIFGDYFDFFTPEDLIKLPFYIYSHKKTGNLDLGEKIISNLHFITLIEKVDSDVTTECNVCEGHGVVECPSCNEYGHVECECCDGDAYVCNDCDSSEEYCSCDEGFNEIECPCCGGDGSTLCKDCRGRNEVTCEKCEGRGEVENPNLSEVVIFNIVTWNPNIISQCEKSYYDPIFPAFKEEIDFRKMGNYLSLEHSIRFMDLSIDLPIGGLYCVSISTNPKLRYNKGHFKLNINQELTRFGTLTD
jgi:hypothetical protein